MFSSFFPGSSCHNCELPSDTHPVATHTIQMNVKISDITAVTVTLLLLVAHPIEAGCHRRYRKGRNWAGWPKYVLCRKGEEKVTEWVCWFQNRGFSCGACPIPKPNPSPSPTLRPTRRPTQNPTPHPTPNPTPRPSGTPVRQPATQTLSPTSPVVLPDGQAISLPPVNGSLVLTGRLNHVRLAVSDDLTLTTLSLVSGDIYNKSSYIRIPLARTYQGSTWEAYSGEIASRTSIYCEGDICTILKLPSQPAGTHYHYVLETFSRRSLTAQEENARFLEQVTFGPRPGELLSNSRIIAAEWVKNQVQLPITSHRQYLRERWNARFDYPLTGGITTRACDQGTRYRQYAFTDLDYHRQVTIKTLPESRKAFLIEGQVRTVVTGNVLTTGRGKIVEDGDYALCPTPGWPGFEIGQELRLVHPEERCTSLVLDGETFGNPKVQFAGDSTPTNPIVILDGFVEPIDMQYYLASDYREQELYVFKNVNDTNCKTLPKVTGMPMHDVVGIYKGEYYLHDSRHVRVTNSLEQVSIDGGGPLVQATSGNSMSRRTRCFSAPMTFLNEEHCVLSTDPNVCGSIETDETSDVTLEDSVFEKVFDASGGSRIIFAVFDQPQEPIVVPYPCTKEFTSRWKKASSYRCTRSPAANLTAHTFKALLKKASQSDDNKYVRDVFFPYNMNMCDISDRERFGFAVKVDGDCYENVHPDYNQVYDFTEWARIHKGGAKPYQDQAKTGTFLLQYPASHSSYRWRDNVQKRGSVLTNLGRLGDTITVHDVQGAEEAFSSILVDPSLAQSAVVCGSPFEVASKPSLAGSKHRGAFPITSKYNNTGQASSVTVWSDIALKAKDQLRQRVAWALSQIVVTNVNRVTEAQMVRMQLFMLIR